MKSFLHPLSYSGNVAELQAVQRLGQVAMLEDHQPIWLLHVASDLGEQAIRCKADRTAQCDAYGAELVLDFIGDRCCTLQRALPADELTGEFIAGHDLLDRDTPFDRSCYVVMVFDIKSGASFNDDQVRA